MVCKNCKKDISVDSKFCEYCGTKVNHVEAEMPVPESETVNLIVAHLEFLGYTIADREHNDNLYTLTCTHPAKSNLYVRYKPSSGITCTATYMIQKDKALSNKTELLELINKVNRLTALTCFMLAEDRDSIICCGWYPDNYSRTLFSNFLTTLETDIRGGLSIEGWDKFYV